MLDFYLVAIYKLALEIAIDFVEVQTMVACDKGLYELYILTYLIDITCTARVVSCSLNTSREGIVTLETYHIVGLPTMQGNLLLLELI